MQWLSYKPLDKQCGKLGRLRSESQVHAITLAGYLISPSLSFFHLYNEIYNRTCLVGLL